MFNDYKIIFTGTCIYLCFFFFFQVNVHLSKPLHIVTMCKHIFVVEKNVEKNDKTLQNRFHRRNDNKKTETREITLIKFNMVHME